MKHTKRIFAIFMSLAMAMTMMIAMSATVFADETSQHTITITNTDQNVSHTYEGYQIFEGKLDASGKKLSDVVWGEGVNGPALLTALKASNSFPATADNIKDGKDILGKPLAVGENLFKNCANAADVAKVLGQFTSTNGENDQAGPIDAVATIIGETDGVLVAAKKISFTEDSKNYTASVTGDGYYFVKDVTAKLDDGNDKSDTLSKYLLAVVNNVTIVAKDTGLTPDKKIVEDSARVDANSAAIGDEITFEVKLPVPDTRKYVDHFVLVMNDTLPAGMTFMEVKSVKVGSDTVPTTVTVAAAGSDTYSTYTKPASVAAAAEATGGQKIKVVFNNFKQFAETAGKNYIGGDDDIVITYTAVVNKNADFTPSGNENTVKFDYSSDPNHDYNGDEPGPNEPKGTTPEDTTKTVLTNIEITKTGDAGKTAALEGAEFTITSNDYNITLVSGEKYDEDANGNYYKLKDGSYTTTAPTSATESSYASTTTKYVKTEFDDVVTTPGTTKTVTVITGSDGKISLKGLDAGTYTIKETKAPSGYNLDETEYTIDLEFDSTSKAIKKGAGSSDDVTFDGTTATAKITIDNKSGAELPSTGGIGTVIFYVLGTLLVVGCGIVLISKRRMLNK